MEKIKYIKLICFISILLFFGCSQSDDQSMLAPEDIIEQKKEVKATLVQMWDAIEKEDMDRYATYIHPDFTAFGENDATLSIGKDAEVAGITAWINSSSNIHTEMVEPRVTIKDNVAWITYYWKDHGTTDGIPFSSSGKSTRIFVLQDGKWLCIHGHYTNPPEGK